MDTRISQDLKEKLIRLPENETFKNNYAKFIKSVFLNLIEDEPNYKALEQIKAQDLENGQFQQEVIFCFNTLLLLTTEFYRKNKLSQQIQEILEEFGFSQEFLKSYLNNYTNFLAFIEDKDNENLKQQLDTTIEFPKLIDIEWKQDFIISNKNQQAINENVFYINLQTRQQDGSQQSIPFKASLQQLTQLTHQVNVALKNIEAQNIE
ncbi:hypothetical protein PPERSA_11582 [Pseudocohnilembus persalinus]|uniref:COMM domain-containing protein 3 n=1 Tax=Pseudocohnilembus persalinus TaxID=266149 RepID=A0A0V0Q9W5_PSEPJ|nr:hypothetical protein PPERSA_11582 [Pseudocohnilembus persalinus]|eukprot:KRW98981.1 hypothetical protein PPERSA_11582 [Pseudocohnilembus persalinus]